MNNNDLGREFNAMTLYKSKYISGEQRIAFDSLSMFNQ